MHTNPENKASRFFQLDFNMLQNVSNAGNRPNIRALSNRGDCYGKRNVWILYITTAAESKALVTA